MPSSGSSGRGGGQESEQRKGDLVAFLAHDLKTADLGGGLPHSAAGRSRPGRPAGQVRHRLDKARSRRGTAGEFFDITGWIGQWGASPSSCPLLPARRRVLPLAEKQLQCIEIQHH